jgi:maleate isomerase
MTSTLAPNGCVAVAVPWGNVTTQVEMDRLRPDGVANVVGHFDLGPDWTEHVAETCRHLLAFDPLVVLVGLNPEMTGNLSPLRHALEAVGDEVPLVIAVDAMLDTLTSLRVRRVSVVTPGWADQREHVAAVFAERDVVVANHVGMERGLGNIGGTPLALVEAALREADHPEAEAVVQLGTNLPALSVTEQLSDELRKPVLSANGVLYATALNRSGLS